MEDLSDEQIEQTEPESDIADSEIDPEYHKKRRGTLSNNFILPLEPVDTPCSEETQNDKKESKKNKREKKNGKFYRFVKRHFLTRKHNPNSVQEIHIVPEGDELKWARRAAGSAASRSSDETGSSGEYRLEVVHDMAEEYTCDS